MTEANQVNGAIRQHLGPLGRFVRIEHSFDMGVPDWYFRLPWASGWLEAKLIPASGRRPDHLTLEQVMWGEQEVKHGGAWFLIGLRESRSLRSWLVYDTVGARKWFEGIENRPLLDLPGRFPTGEIVRVIAPRPPRSVSSSLVAGGEAKRGRHA